MNLLEAKKELCNKLDIDYSNLSIQDVFTEQNLIDYINKGCNVVWSLARWTFAEFAKTWTLNTTDVTDGYINIPEDIAPASLFSFWIDGKEAKKIDLMSLKRYMQDYPQGKEYLVAVFGDNLFFNPNVISIGSVIDAYGKKRFIPFTSSSTDGELLPFSDSLDNFEDTGNEAVLDFAFAEALGSEKKKQYQQADAQRKVAMALLSPILTETKTGRANTQFKSKAVFDVPDFFNNGNY